MIPSLTEFWRERYLDGYIKEGGSKVKLVTSQDVAVIRGFLERVVRIAKGAGYVTAFLDANDLHRVNVFANVYQAAVRELDLRGLIRDYRDGIIRRLGYNPDEIPEDKTVVEWACEARGRDRTAFRREVQERLELDLFRNRLVNRTFATATLQLASNILGAKEGELSEEDEAFLYGWMRAEPASLRDLRKFHVFARIDRYNARLMLRSLVELARLAGGTGVFLAVGGLEILLARKENGRPLYPKAARDEFYESIRQLIDEVDMLNNFMIVLGFRKPLVDDRAAGLMSYEALWLRIQNEVEGRRPNLFRDFLDLDAVESIYDS